MLEINGHARLVQPPVQRHCSAYDCEFVALAMKLDAKFVTMDKKLLRAFPNRAIALSEC